MAPLLHPLTSSHDTVQGCHSLESYKFPDFSLTFHWPLNTFHWPFINEKQSMFIFTLAFFCRPPIFFSSFSVSFLFSRKEGEGINWKKAFTTKTTDHNYYKGSGVQCQIDCFACPAAYFSSFPKENAFQSLEENLWTINQKTEFPDLSLTLKNLFFPDFSLTVATLLLHHNKFLPFPK